MLIRTIALLVLMSISALAGAAFQAPSANRDADARAIRHEIERIFQAFIDKDRDALVDTHIANWRGYLTWSRSVIKGRDAYMEASVGGGMPPRGQGMVGYAIKEFDTVFYGDSTAGVGVNLATGSGAGGSAQGDTLISIENMTSGFSRAQTKPPNVP